MLAEREQKVVFRGRKWSFPNQLCQLVKQEKTHAIINPGWTDRFRRTTIFLASFHYFCFLLSVEERLNLLFHHLHPLFHPQSLPYLLNCPPSHSQSQHLVPLAMSSSTLVTLSRCLLTFCLWFLFQDSRPASGRPGHNERVGSLRWLCHLHASQALASDLFYPEHLLARIGYNVVIILMSARGSPVEGRHLQLCCHRGRRLVTMSHYCHYRLGLVHSIWACPLRQTSPTPLQSSPKATVFVVTRQTIRLILISQSTVINDQHAEHEQHVEHLQ